MAVIEGRTVESRGIAGFPGLWGASAASNLADGLLLVSLPLLAVSLQASPAAVATVAAAAGLPWLLAPLAGALADRVDRKWMAVWGNAGRALMMAATAALSAMGALDIVTLTVIALVVGLVEVVVDSANDTLLPGTVTDASIDQAVRRTKITSTLGNLFIGPGLAGLLFAAHSGLPFLVAAVTYALCAFLESFLRGEYKPERDTGQSVLHDLREGAAWFRRNVLLTRLALMLAIIVAAQSMATTQLVLYAVAPGPMGLSEEMYGVLRFATGAGGLLAGLVASSVIKRVGRAGTLRLCALGAVVMFIMPALTSAVVPVLVGLLLGGAAELLWVVIVRSVAQTITPMAMLGRVGSIYTLIAWGSIPLGSFAGGVIGTWLGLKPVFVVAAVVTVIGALILLGPISNAAVERARAEGREAS